jgi:type II secretory pathway component PulF
VVFVLYRVTAYVSGTSRTLVVESGNAVEAAKQVRKRLGEDRTLITRVVPAGREFSLEAFKFWDRVGPRDLELFCRRSHALVSAGVTTLEALETVASQTEKNSLKKALLQVADNVREGFPLVAAFRDFPRVFPAVFSHTVAAAEESSALEEALLSLAAHFEREARFKEKLRQAMAYPTVVACFALLVAVGLFTFVVPKFAALLQSADVPLPALTRVMMNVSAHTGLIALFLVGASLVGVPLFRVLWQKEGVRSRLEAVFARLPVLGKIVSRAAAARVCRSLSLMTKVGVPLVRAMEVARGVASFSSFRKELEDAAEAVREGKPLADALSRSRWFPATGVKMAAVGENSGRLSEMLDQSASLFETEVDLLVQKLPPLVEAGMVVFVGGLVLLVMLSLFLPIFSMYQTVK